MKLSIVTTMYCSEAYIVEFYERISSAAEMITEDYELIFVNDGSPDKSLEIAISLHKKDLKVRVIDLSRNFGHHKAIMTGLAHASGDQIFLIDCDLEEDPSWLNLFMQELNDSPGVDVVYGVQRQRKGEYFEKISGALFFDFFNLLSDVKVPKNQTVARLMTKRYVNSLLQFSERELVFVGLCELAGYSQKRVYVNKGHKNCSTYNLSRKIDMAINFVVSFSSRPLVLIFYLGLFVTMISAVCAVYIVCSKVLFGIPVDGWASIVTSIWFIGGLLMFSVGIVGIYLSKIFIEVKNRPFTVIRNIYSSSNDEELL